MIDLNKVGSIISICRREKGYTQDDLASRLGVTAQAISKWERGLSLPDADMLLDISKILDLSIDDLLKGIMSTKTAKQISSESPITVNPVNIFEFLLPDEILIEISSNLCIDNQSFTDHLLSEIIEMRRRFVMDYGFCLPIVRLRDNSLFVDGKYKIYFRKKCFGSGHIHKDLLFTVSDDTSLNGIVATDFQGLRILWMNESERNDAGDLPYFNGVNMIITHLSDLILKNPDVIITRQMVRMIIENLSEKHHILVSETIPARINYGRLRQILARIVKAKKPINDIVTILETIDQLIDKNIENEEIVKEIIKFL